MLKKFLLCFILLTLITVAAWADNQQGFSLEFTYRSYMEKIPKELKDKLDVGSINESFHVIVEFDKIIDSDFLYKQVQDMSKGERRSYAINTLQNFTTSYQKDVMDYLKQMEKSGKVERLSQLWLTNSIGMKATKEVVEEVAKHPSVALIWPAILCKPLIVKDNEGYENNNPLDSRTIGWNLLKVKADQVWALGYTGQNIVVGHLDTGCNYNHNDLNDHMWDGSPTYPHHGWDFEDNDDDPMDQSSIGHGTRTAGMVAGDGTAGTTTGVAPDAQIMILKTSTNIDMEDAITFGIANGAHIFTCSVGFDSANAGGMWGYLSTQFRSVSQTCLTMGIPCWSVAAGNGKQPGHYTIPYDINIPANPPPAWYGSGGHTVTMAVGSTNDDNTISSFSSLGPVNWFFAPWYDYMYPPGLIKPDVCAPGGTPTIESLSHTNPTGYVSGYVGTSFSAPHLAGVVALMLSKNPDLTPREVDSIIQLTCLDLGSAGRDNTFGAGLIDALEAVNAVPIPAVEEEPEITITPTNPSMKCFPNPARNSASIIFTLPRTAEISIDIHDVSGRRVTTLANGKHESGVHNIPWNRKDEKGIRVPQGVYFIQLKSEGIKTQGKIILLD